jgi:hypothetical protein
MNKSNEKRTEIIFNNFKRTCRSRIHALFSAYRPIWRFGRMSIQASGLTMTNEQQARRMLSSAANPAGGLVFAGEFYEACRCFLAGTDPSIPEKTLIHPNDLK